MSRNALVAVIAGAVMLVALLAALTPTVIAGDNDRESREVRITRSAGPAPFPAPLRQGRLPRLRACLQRHGLRRPGQGSGSLPSPDQFRRVFRDCAPRLGR